MKVNLSVERITMTGQPKRNNGQATINFSQSERSPESYHYFQHRVYCDKSIIVVERGNERARITSEGYQTHPFSNLKFGTFSSQTKFPTVIKFVHEDSTFEISHIGWNQANFVLTRSFCAISTYTR